MTSRFEDIILRFIEDNAWETYEVDGDVIQIEFESDSGAVQTLYCTWEEDVVEFDIPSAAAFDRSSQIDHEVSTQLLKRNALIKVGAWVLEEIEDQICYSLMWNEDLDVLEAMSSDKFAEYVYTMVGECEAFDLDWKENNPE